jgi:hypothetical protein
MNIQVSEACRISKDAFENELHFTYVGGAARRHYFLKGVFFFRFFPTFILSKKSLPAQGLWVFSVFITNDRSPISAIMLTALPGSISGTASRLN